MLADLALTLYEAAQHVGTLGRATSTDQFPNYSNALTFLATREEPDRGRRNLTTGFVGGFNRDNVRRIGNLGVTFNTVADADTNARIDRDPDEYADLRSESAELRRIDGTSGRASRFVVDTLYQILRRSAGVSVTYTPEGSWPLDHEVATISSIDNPSPLGNDTLVTIPSGHGVGFFQPLVRNSFTFRGAAGRNHSNVANRGVAQRVVPWMIEAERRAGGLR